MSADQDDDAATIRSLRKANEEKDRRIGDLEAKVRDLKKQVARLIEELEAERRKGRRQAAPFRKDKRKSNPKKPGRKRGEGEFKNKDEPEPTEPPVDVPVDSPFCSCGGELGPERTERVTVTEIPEAPKPLVTPYLVGVCLCKKCGKTVRGKHPDIADDQFGASAHRYGPRARAAAHVLHYGIGVTVRKAPEVLRLLTGLEITQGAITQDALRQMDGPVGAEYQRLRGKVRAAEYAHTDDTGWRVGGENAHLMAFETTGQDAVTVFQIRDRHRNEEVRELVPSDFAGVLTTDRGVAYDAEALSDVRQNKCVAHLKRNLSKASESQHPGARSFTNRLVALINEAVELWQSHKQGRMGKKQYLNRGRWIKHDLEDHLRLRPLTDPGNRRLLVRLHKQERLGNLLRFLEDPNIEPTNNRAERALRPAVIARKVSQCSKTSRGADAHAGFMSVLQTIRRQGKCLVDGLTNLLRAPPAVAT